MSDSTPIRCSRRDPNLLANLFDVEEIRSFGGFEGDEAMEVFDDLLGAYLEDGTRCARVIARAVEEGDLHALQTAAHSLKGSSRSVCAMFLGDLCEALERGARSGDPDGLARNMAEEVIAAFDDVRRVSVRYLDGTGC